MLVLPPGPLKTWTQYTVMFCSSKSLTSRNADNPDYRFGPLIERWQRLSLHSLEDGIVRTFRSRVCGSALNLPFHSPKTPWPVLGESGCHGGLTPDIHLPASPCSSGGRLRCGAPACSAQTSAWPSPYCCWSRCPWWCHTGGRRGR